MPLEKLLNIAAVKDEIKSVANLLKKLDGSIVWNELCNTVFVSKRWAISIRGSLGPAQCTTNKRHLDRFSRFCRAY